MVSTLPVMKTFLLSAGAFPSWIGQGDHIPTVGYKGGLRLLEKILTALLDRKDRDDPETKFELVL